MTKAKRWRDFERLAEQIFRELSPTATVRWNDHIEGQSSETTRQIDVSIRWEDEAGERLAIVQAKDWGRPADIKAVDEFASVIRDVGASAGILVCRSGFSRNALNYAHNLGIRLYNLHDAQSANWNHELTIPILWVDLLPQLQITFTAWLDEGETIDQGEIFLTQSDDSGDLLSVYSAFIEAWNSGSTPRTTSGNHVVRFKNQVVARLASPTGQSVLRTLNEFRLVYCVKQTAWLGQFRPEECRGLIDYLDQNAFTVSYCPVGEIPTERGAQWQQVADPEQVALTLRGSFVTTEGFQVTSPSMLGWTDIRYLGPR